MGALSATAPPSTWPTDSSASNAAAPALSPEHLREVAQARLRRKKLDRAANVAAFGGWVSAILAACAAPFALMDWESGVIALALGVVAYHEFKGRRMLRALDPAAPRLLACNQIAFGIMIILYSLWKILGALTGDGAYAQAIAAEPMLADMLGPIEDLIRLIYLAVYITLILGTIAFQGGTAWYYFTRAKHLREYIEQTPPWIIDLLRSGDI